MRILFDLKGSQPSGTTKFHGGGEYIKTVFKHLVENYSAQDDILAYYNYAQNNNKWIIDNCQEYKKKCYNIHELSELKGIFEKEKIDIFYSGLPYALKEDDIPAEVFKIGTVHGLRGIEKPYDMYLAYYFDGAKAVKKNIKLAIERIFEKKLKQKQIMQFQQLFRFLDKVVCVSKHTQYALYNFLPEIDQSKLQLCYTPNKFVENYENKQLHSEVKKKFIFLIGANRWEKNSFRALLALDSLMSLGKLPDYQVILTGNTSNRIRKRLHNLERFQFLGYVEPQELEELYAGCDFFIYPSLNEGFGMPPLEAMKYGKTCIVSAVCSLPEICQDSVIYVNPYDTDEIKNRILQAVDSKLEIEKVKEQFNKIKKKQEDDLDLLCKFIVNKGNI